MRAPDGCPGCNPDHVLPFLHERGLQVEELPTGTQNTGEIITCDRCERSWLLMPRNGDAKAPVA